MERGSQRGEGERDGREDKETKYMRRETEGVQAWTDEWIMDG